MVWISQKSHYFGDVNLPEIDVTCESLRMEKGPKWLYRAPLTDGETEAQEGNACILIFTKNKTTIFNFLPCVLTLPLPRSAFLWPHHSKGCSATSLSLCSFPKLGCRIHWTGPRLHRDAQNVSGSLIGNRGRNTGVRTAGGMDTGQQGANRWHLLETEKGTTWRQFGVSSAPKLFIPPKKDPVLHFSRTVSPLKGEQWSSEMCQEKTTAGWPL